MSGRRRRDEPIDGEGLFPPPKRAKGSAERSVEASLALWRREGRAIDPAASRMLRAQGLAVDLAMTKGDEWKIGNATRTYLDLIVGLGLVSRATTADPFVEAMKRAMADDTYGDDEHPDTALRDAP